MGREWNVLLRRTSPLAAVLVLLAPATGYASSFSPDPPPGANGLRPDPAPSAPAAAQRPPAVRTPIRTIAQPSQVQAVTTPAPVRTAPSSRPRRPVERVRSHKVRIAIPKLELPPVIVPAFIPSTLGRRPQVDLAALALALAALTAGSGAGLVRAWSRR